MQRGDLSNRVGPRIVIVFDEAIGKVPDRNKTAYEKAVARGRMWDAIGLMDLNEMMLRKILDLAHRKNINISLATWLGEDAAMAVSERMDEEGLPVRGCFASTPERLARDLPYNPDIVCVYDPDPSHLLMYGSKGMVLSSPEDIARFM